MTIRIPTGMLRGRAIRLAFAGVVAANDALQRVA